MRILQACLLGLGSSLFQLFATMIAVAIYAYVGFILMLIPLHVANRDLVDASLALVLLVIVYGVMWCIYWFVNMPNGPVQYFKTKLIFATLPLLGYFHFYTPSVYFKTMPMIPSTLPDQFDFGLLVAAVVLFPLYSIGLVRFVLPDDRKNGRNLIGLLAVLVVVGLTVFYVGWETMPVFYSKVKPVPFPV